MMAFAVPEIILCAASLTVLVLDSLFQGRGRLSLWTALFAVSAALAVFILNQAPLPFFLAHANLARDPLGQVIQVFILLAGLGVLILLADYFRDDPAASSRVSALILFSLLGMFVLASAGDFLVLYLGLELMTFPIYLAVASHAARKGRLSYEASVKYFVMGGIASAFFLYGVSLVFAAGGTLKLYGPWAQGPGVLTALSVTGLTLMAATVFFKLSAVPLHFWAPDAYEGAPTPVTAFMATAVKGAAFIFLFKTLGALAGGIPAQWTGLIALISLISMTWGNWLAIRQTHLNRLMAYSSIAHVGYMLIGVTGLNAGGSGGWSGPVESLLFYLASYMAMTLGAFSVLSAFRIETLDDVRGLSKRSPVAAALLALFLLSLTGIPPTAGFLAKFYIFLDAVKEGRVGLAIAGALNSALAAFYYLKVIRAAYLEEEEGDARRVPIPRGPAAVMIACAALVIFLGLCR